MPVLESLHQNSHDIENFTWRSNQFPRYSQDYCHLNCPETESTYSQGSKHRKKYNQSEHEDEIKYKQSGYFGSEEAQMSKYRLYQTRTESIFGSDSGYSQHTSSTAENSVISDAEVAKKKDMENVHRSIEYIGY